MEDAHPIGQRRRIRDEDRDREWIVFELSRQVFWLIVLTLTVRMVTALASRRVISQGG